jgi:GDP-L-fucose synthase
MNKNSKIFLAGHKGMVGSAIYRTLINQGFAEVLTRDYEDLDLTRQSDVEQFFHNEKPEYVILAAAKVGGIMANSTYTADFIYQNIMIAANVIDASYKYGVKKLLNLGSSCIYPKMAPQPLKEEYLLSGPLEISNEAYAVAKISAIKLCRYYNEQHGTNFISVMPTNMYGQNDNFNLFTSHVLPALLRKFHLGKLRMEGNYNLMRNDIGFFDKNKKALNFSDKEIDAYCDSNLIYNDAIGIWGTGKPYREFLFVDDCADALLFILNQFDYKDIGEHINVGTGKDLTIVDLAELINDVTGYSGGIKFDPSKPDGTPKKLLDVSRLKSLGWEAKTSLDVGVLNMYEWYKKQSTVKCEL